MIELLMTGLIYDLWSRLWLSEKSQGCDDYLIQMFLPSPWIVSSPNSWWCILVGPIILNWLVQPLLFTTTTNIYFGTLGT